MLQVQLQQPGVHRIVAPPEQTPATYVFHPLAGLRCFRRYVGGRWERWVMRGEDHAREGVTFWVRTGDAVHTPHLNPTPNVEVQLVESWPKDVMTH
jgi:hypothetical protein